MDLTVYRALDDETLAALASKGLVRRAQKDLERGPPTLRERRADAVVLDFAAEACLVTLPAAGPQAAACTCPADGVCRHILAGTLFLREGAGEGSQEPRTKNQEPAPQNQEPASELLNTQHPELNTPEGEQLNTQNSTLKTQLLELDEAALVAWAGRAVYRQALDDLVSSPELEIDEGPQRIVMRFPQQNIAVRWLEGAGPRGSICSCRRPEVCRHRVAAVLLYRARHGVPLPGLEQAVLAATSGAPRTRAQVLASLGETLAELAAVGFVRLAEASEERLRTLAISAHGVDLPRLERALRALSDQVGWYVRRDVRASAEALLTAMAATAALAHAIERAGPSAPAALIGEHRSRYYEVGTLELAGMGAQQWRTRSGYVGLTVFFWDVTARRWTSWSDSRPDFHAGIRFDAAQRYRQAGPWEAAPPEQLSRAQLRLSPARRNREGRLSSTGSARAVLLGASDPALLDLSGVAFDSWADLARHAAATQGSGLAEVRQADRLALVRPARWDEPRYDQLRQALVRPVYDRQGRALALVQPHHDNWPFAVDTLRLWDPAAAQTWGVLGSVLFQSGALELSPIALYSRQADGGTAVVNLTLDRPGVQAAAPPPVIDRPVPQPSEDVDDEQPEALEDDRPADGGVARLLGAGLALLEQIAEQGGSRADAEGQLRDLAARLRQIGMAICADRLDTLADQRAALRHSAAPDPRPAAHALLRAAYVLRLARDQLSLTQALAALR
ncbi:MAG TPA: hypothetical protein VFS21_20070 [Roseiflexaceae bacterium]|nr:hypothetical protein [Roseiflexaceae bacterium]